MNKIISALIPSIRAEQNKGILKVGKIIMHGLKKVYNKAFICFVLIAITIFLQITTVIYASTIDDIVDGFTPPKNTTIIHYLNTGEKPYTKIANAVRELWVGDHHRFTVVANWQESVKILWYSSNPEIASIKKTTGELTALAVGETTITMWDSVNRKKHKVTLTVKAVPVLPEIPREWYTITEKINRDSEKGIQLVLKSEYRYLYEQCSMLRIPESIDGQKVVWVCIDNDLESPLCYLSSIGFKQLKMLQCPASIEPYVVGDIDELVYPEQAKLMDHYSDYYKRIHVPESVELLVSDGMCDKELEEVRIPASVKFFCCNAIEDYYDYQGIPHGENAWFVVDGNNTNYYSISDVLFAYPYYAENSHRNDWIQISGSYYYMHAGKRILLSYPRKKTGSTYYVPEGIERIEEGAFSGAQYLKKIILPDSVTEIGEYAFQWIKNKVEITIPASVTKFEDSGNGGPFGIYWPDDGIQDGFVIITPKGSAAEAYAIEKGIEYRNE